MSTKDWLSIEKLVHIFEKSISPSSTVEHNVFLPDLTSNSNSKRQCDIVIRTGTKPRTTTTIVEVQSRSRKFDLTYFQGLIQKMKDVGAQHLICVSTKGFTKTIKEKARELGGTVRLIKLTRSETENLPYEFIKFQFSDNRPIYDFVTPPKIVLIRDKQSDSLHFEMQQPKFIIPELSKVFGINELIQYYFNTFKHEG